MQVSALIGGVVGLLVGTALNRAQRPWKRRTQPNAALEAGGIAYGLLAAVILLVTLVPPVNRVLSSITWTLQFPAVSTTAGFSTPAEKGYLFHIFSHPGTLILFTIAVTLYIFRHKKGLERVDLGKALKATWRSGLPASVGTLFMIGLSTTMEHAGMTADARHCPGKPGQRQLCTFRAANRGSGVVCHRQQRQFQCVIWGAAGKGRPAGGSQPGGGVGGSNNGWIAGQQHRAGKAGPGNQHQQCQGGMKAMCCASHCRFALPSQWLSGWWRC